MKRKDQVIICHNHELDDIYFAVCKADDPEFWIDAFEKKSSAILFCAKKGYKIVRWTCSVDCDRICLDCAEPGPETVATKVI
jgi:hypothetical protein